MNISTLQSRLEEKSKETARIHLEALKTKVIKDLEVCSVPASSLESLAKHIANTSTTITINWIVSRLIEAITPETVINQTNSDLKNFIDKVNAAQEQIDEIRAQLT